MIQQWFFVLKGVLELVAEELGWEEIPHVWKGWYIPR